MKKIYQSPQIQVLKIATASIVCTSLTSGGNASDAGITTADSRGFDFDFDYEEDY